VGAFRAWRFHDIQKRSFATHAPKSKSIKLARPAIRPAQSEADWAGEMLLSRGVRFVIKPSVDRVGEVGVGNALARRQRVSETAIGPRGGGMTSARV
jgi:hypothetical protein